MVGNVQPDIFKKAPVYSGAFFVLLHLLFPSTKHDIPSSLDSAKEDGILFSNLCKHLFLQ